MITVTQNLTTLWVMSNVMMEYGTVYPGQTADLSHHHSKDQSVRILCQSKYGGMWYLSKQH